MLKYKEHFDLSNFPKGSKYFCNDNKKVPGKMKDEYARKIIYEGEFLKSKIYSLKPVVGGEKSTLKVHNSLLIYEEYEYTRFNKEVIRNNMRGFKSKNTKYFLMKVIKYSYVILIIKDIFFLMEYILYHMVTKIYQQEIDKIKQKFYQYIRHLT